MSPQAEMGLGVGGWEEALLREHKQDRNKQGSNKQAGTKELKYTELRCSEWLMTAGDIRYAYHTKQKPVMSGVVAGSLVILIVAGYDDT